MKARIIISPFARRISRCLLIAGLMGPAWMLPMTAKGQVTPPILEFASGLPGKQVRLTWPSAAGVSYRVEKSTTLGSWSQVALVSASGATTVWVDPEATVNKAFYRVSQPQAEVFSISPPLLSPTGGTLVIQGQLIPAGSFLVIQIPGQAPVLVPLSALGNGNWEAVVAGMFEAGSDLSISIVDDNGVPIHVFTQPIRVTATGLAADSPPSLPPAAPVSEGRRLKVQNLGSSGNDGVEFSNIGSSGQDGVEVNWRTPKFSNIGSSGQDGVEVKWRTASSLGDIDDSDSYGAFSAQRKGINEKGLPFADSSSVMGAAWLGKRGYEYYLAKSDLNAAGMHSNPFFNESQNQGSMPDRRLANNKHPDLMKREMGPGAISPAPSGLPGEVSFQFCALSLAVPAGPPLELVHTYRSKPPVSSSGGSGTAGSHWERCYDISIKPIPLAAGSSATRLEVCDGGGRYDIFYRQPNGTYRCDGMFREGSFVGDTFTLTFADKGTWTFKPLSDPNAPGQISTITDRNNVALTCVYTGTGQLDSVRSQFGQQLTMAYGQDGSLSSVTDHTGRSVSYTYCGPQDPDGSPGDLKSISAPQVGPNSPFGPTTFTYQTGEKIPELNGNLLSITDGANRLLEAFTYSTQGDPTAVDFDTCATHDRHRTSSTTGGVTGEVVTMSFEPLSSGAYMMTQNDELGRVIQTTFDRLHREISVREYTGFSAPGAMVTSASLPLSGKLYQTDPDFFETTCAYNADSRCTRITYPDGSQQLTTYDRDFSKNCSVRDRGNARVRSLRTPSGEMRTVTCDYLPGFGAPESARPGAPIGGLSIKGGRNPGGNLQAQGRKGGMVNGAINVASAYRKGWDGSVKGNLSRGGRAGGDIGWIAAARKGWDGSIKGNLAKEEGGRHTPFHNKYRPQFSSSAIGGITGGVIAGIVVGQADNDDSDYSSSAGYFKNVVTNNGNANDSFCSSPVRIVSAYGQVSTFGYNANGDCTSATSPVAGRGSLFSYNTYGQLTSSTVLNGANPTFTEQCDYDAATGFLSSVVSDPAGLHITTSFERDNLGLVTRVVDPLGNDWLYQYNGFDDCVRIQSPPGPSRISTNFTTDSSGRFCRCDTEHRGLDGSLVSSNPVYSTFYVRNERGNLVRVASEERPVNSPPSALAPAPTDLASYDVCDITLDNAGQVTRVSTPAACRGQATDLACDFTYTERGQLHRCIEGGLGTVGAVTTEYQYDSTRSVVRCTLVVSGIPSPQSLCTYDGFHRPSSITDPMGNVTQYAYGNDGSVTTSIYGEQLNDQPGSGSNLLLARYTARRRVEVLKSNRTIDFQKPDKVIMCSLGDPFFSVETEDDTLTVERFTPGSTAPTTTEVTVVDCSPAGLVQQITCNGDVLAVVTHDTAGRAITCSNGACSRTVTRNAKGQITGCGNTDHFSIGGIPSKTFTVSRVLDVFGRCIQTTDGVGNTSHFAYDSLGRCVSETEPGGLVVHTAYDSSSTTGPFSSQVSADFDGDGNADLVGSSLVRCGELVSSSDSRGYPTTFSSDALGRSVRCDRPDGTFETCSFDSRGFRVQGTFSDGSSRDFTCDLNGRTTSIDWSNLPSGVLAVGQKTMQYDGQGNLTRCAQGSSVVTATYDSCCAQTSETQDDLTVSQTFNHRGRSGLTYPDGKRFQESRNAFGELVSVSGVTPAGVVLSPPIVSQDYLGHQVCRTVQRNGVTTTFTYRGDGEVSPAGAEDFSFGSCVRETITSASSVVLSDKTVSRDSNQRLCTCTDGFIVQGQEKTRITVTPRDVFGNVTSCVISRRDSATSLPVIESSVSYTYDIEGSRLSEIRNGVSGTYTQNPSLPPADLQVGQYSTWPGGGLTWDDNGNIATFQKGTSQLTFVHDAEGKLVRVDDQTGHAIVGYDYNSRGQRTAKLVPSPTTGNLEIIIKFAYDGPDCIQELGTDNLADMTFVCADGIPQLISTRSGTIYYPHGGLASRGLQHWGDRSESMHKIEHSGDPHEYLDGRVCVITNATGSPVDRFACDESGKPIFLNIDGTPSSATSSSIGLRWLSPSCAWEPELGMFACPGTIYSPDLATPVSKVKALDAKGERKKEFVGHVSLLK